MTLRTRRGRRYVLDIRRSRAIRLGTSIPLSLEREGAEVLCPEDDYCRVFEEDERLIVYDDGHFTLEGAEFAGRLMAETGFYEALFDLP